MSRPYTLSHKQVKNESYHLRKRKRRCVNISLSVKDFGPISQGTITIKPLTIFIGPNNTGKSYMAMLYYSIARALTRAFKFPFYFLLPDFLSEGIVNRLTKDLIETLNKEKKTSEMKNIKAISTNIIINYIIENINDLERTISSYVDEYLKKYVEEELARVFSSSDLRELIRNKAKQAVITIKVSNPELGKARIRVTINQKGELKLKTVSLRLNFLRDKNTLIRFLQKRTEGTLKLLGRAELINLLYARDREKKKSNRNIKIKRIVEMLLYDLADSILDSLIKLISIKTPYYLPASRSGILQGYLSLARALIFQATIAPIKGGAEIPPFSPLVADFISMILEAGENLPSSQGFIVEEGIEKKSMNVGKEVNLAINQIENIIEGSVILRSKEPSRLPPEIFYRINGLELRLGRASSMVAELAPLDIMLKHGIMSKEKESSLIIEEPESHLHPDKQAAIADFLALLVNEVSVQTIITTHSDTLLYRLSDLITLSNLKANEIRDLGINAKVTLSPRKVKVYLFTKDAEDEGTTIKEVNISKKGIQEEHLRGVIERLYEDSMRIYYKVQETLRKK